MAKPKAKRSAKAMRGSKPRLAKTATASAPEPAAATSRARPAKSPPAPAKTKGRLRPGTSKSGVRSIGQALDGARIAITRGDLGGALAQLLSAWRAVPAPAIAAAIERIGERAKQGLFTPSGTPKERNAGWDAAARKGDPAMLGVLLDSLTNTKGSAETLARIELLVKHRDPRVAARIVDLIETPAYNASVSRTSAFWKRMFALLPLLGDPRILERQRGFAEAWKKNRELNAPERPVMANRLAKVLPDIERAYAASPVLSADDAARCGAVTEALAGAADPSGQTEAGLLAAIYVAPDDDGARMVYADWLQQRDDPRGEFIALQIARGRGEPDKRERALVREHTVRWLGPLAKTVDLESVVFERGFLASCAVHDDLDDNPMWATVHTLAGAPGSDACSVPSLRWLRDLTAAHIVQLAKLTKPLAVERLGWRGPIDPVVADAEAAAAFARIRVLPKLRHLELDGSWPTTVALADLAYIWKAPFAAQLDTLVLPADVRGLADAIVTFGPTTIRSVVIRGENDGGSWRMVLQRDPEGRLSQLSVTSPGWPAAEADDGALAGLRGLPADALTSVHVLLGYGDLWQVELRPRLDRELARQTRLVQPAVILSRGD